MAYGSIPTVRRWIVHRYCCPWERNIGLDNSISQILIQHEKFSNFDKFPMISYFKNSAEIYFSLKSYVWKLTPCKNMKIKNILALIQAKFFYSHSLLLRIRVQFNTHTYLSFANLMWQIIFWAREHLLTDVVKSELKPQEKFYFNSYFDTFYILNFSKFTYTFNQSV